MMTSRTSRAAQRFLVCAFWLFPIVAWAAGALQITNLSYAPGAFGFGWSAPDAGVVYTVQYREAVADSIWLMPSHSEPWPIAEAQWTDLNATLSPTRFYRVLSFLPAQRGKVLTNTLSSTLSTNFISFMLAYQGITGVHVPRAKNS